MLVLERFPEESIVIDNEIDVKIIKVSGDTVRLGVTAPKSVSVHRKEIQDAINKEKELIAAGLSL